MLLWHFIFCFLIAQIYAGCPPGSEYIPQLDYCLTVMQNASRYGFFQAEEDCRRRGGDLISIHNSFENALILMHAVDVNFNGNAFIGANSLTGQWEWTDGTNMTYKKWAPGEPESGMQCAMFHMFNGLWYGADCDQHNASYFCKTPSLCPDNWIWHNFNCYYFNDTTPTYHTWDEARGFCKQNGGELASIHSLTDNHFLSSFATPRECQPTWIGLQYNSTFSWTDGSPVDFNNATDHDVNPLPAVYWLYPSCYSWIVGWWGDVGKDAAASSFICEQPPIHS